MSRIERSGQSASVGWPYDPAAMTAFTIDNENDPINAYRVIVEITGADRDHYSAIVSTYSGGDYVDLAAEPEASDDPDAEDTVQLGAGESMVLTGDLPQPLEVQVEGTACGDLIFTYGTPADDDILWFRFHSSDETAKEGGEANAKGPNGGKYCAQSAITDADDDVVGTRLTCWFPGW